MQEDLGFYRGHWIGLELRTLPWSLVRNALLKALATAYFRMVGFQVFSSSQSCAPQTGLHRGLQGAARAGLLLSQCYSLLHGFVSDIAPVALWMPEADANAAVFLASDGKSF